MKRKQADFDPANFCDGLFLAVGRSATGSDLSRPVVPRLQTPLRPLGEGITDLFAQPGDANRKHRAMFEKLKDAYVKARYSKHYRISEEELNWLGERVEELGQIVHEICSERFAELVTKAT